MGVAKDIWLLLLMAWASVAALSLPSTASAFTVASRDMALGPPTMAPYGFLEFCTHDPQACGLDAAPERSEHDLMQSQWEAVFASPPPSGSASVSDRAATITSQPSPRAAEDGAPNPPMANIQFKGLTEQQPPALPIAYWGSHSQLVLPDVFFASPTGLDQPPPAIDGADVAPLGLAELSLGAELTALLRRRSPDVGVIATKLAWLQPLTLDRPPSAPLIPEADTSSDLFPGAPSQMDLTQAPPSPEVGSAAIAPSRSVDASQPATTTDKTSPPTDVRTGEDAAARMALLATVNARINAAIIPALDMEAFGANDVWTLPLERSGRAMGNCKHYALEKQQALIRAGLAATDLSIAIVRTPVGAIHAVLLVRTPEGELVLDNLTSQIKPWREVGYTWLERQTPGHPLTWVSLNLRPGREPKHGA